MHFKYYVIQALCRTISISGYIHIFCFYLKYFFVGILSQKFQVESMVKYSSFAPMVRKTETVPLADDSKSLQYKNENNMSIT